MEQEKQEILKDYSHARSSGGLEMIILIQGLQIMLQMLCCMSGSLIRLMMRSSPDVDTDAVIRAAVLKALSDAAHVSVKDGRGSLFPKSDLYISLIVLNFSILFLRTHIST